MHYCAHDVQNLGAQMKNDQFYVKPRKWTYFHILGRAGHNQVKIEAHSRPHKTEKKFKGRCPVMSSLFSLLEDDYLNLIRISFVLGNNIFLC